MVGGVTEVQAQISSRYSRMLASLISFYTVQCHMASFNIIVFSLLCKVLSLGAVVEWDPFCLISQIIHFTVSSTFQTYPKFAHM
jgi:hypothetical protein